MRRLVPILSVLLVLPGVAAAQSAAARQGQGTAFWGSGPGLASNLFERVTGSFDLDVTDRVPQEAMANGDDARMRAEIRRGTDTYQIELEEAGFQKGTRGIPLVPLHGGVRLDARVFGNSGQGPASFTGAPAVVSVWGLARVTRNGELLTGAARVFVVALASGIHADDGSFHMLGNARPEDSEVVLILDRLPATADPRGFMLLGFDDVRIERNGRAVASRLVVDSVTEPATRAGATAAGAVGGSGLLYGGGTVGTGAATAPTGVTSVAASDVIGAGGRPLAATSVGTAAAANATAAAQASNTPLATAAENAQAAATTAAVQAATPTATPNDDPLTNAEVLGPSAVISGIPASPPVANNGQNVAPLPSTPAPLNASGATPLISTPAPLNAQSATSLLQTPTPLNAVPATQAPSAIPLPAGIAPANALPGLPGGATLPASP